MYRYLVYYRGRFERYYVIIFDDKIVSEEYTALDSVLKISTENTRRITKTIFAIKATFFRELNILINPP